MTQLALDGRWKTHTLSYHHKCMYSSLPLSLAASSRPVGCPAGGSSSSRPSGPVDGCSSLWPYWAVDGCSVASLASTASAPFILLSRLQFRSRLPLSQGPTALPTRLRSALPQRRSVFMEKKTNTRRFIEKTKCMFFKCKFSFMGESAGVASPRHTDTHQIGCTLARVKHGVHLNCNWRCWVKFHQTTFLGSSLVEFVFEN